MSLNPGPLILGVRNARSVRNKGPLLAYMVASNDLDCLCLMESHIHLFGSDSFIWCITPPDFIFPHRPHPSGVGVVASFSLDPPFYQSFENMVVSFLLHGSSLLLACIYLPLGSCTCKFQEEFMFFLFHVVY